MAFFFYGGGFGGGGWNNTSSFNVTLHIIVYLIPDCHSDTNSFIMIQNLSPNECVLNVLL